MTNDNWKKMKVSKTISYISCPKTLSWHLEQLQGKRCKRIVWHFHLFFLFFFVINCRSSIVSIYIWNIEIDVEHTTVDRQGHLAALSQISLDSQNRWHSLLRSCTSEEDTTHHRLSPSLTSSCINIVALSIGYCSRRRPRISDRTICINSKRVLKRNDRDSCLIRESFGKGEVTFMATG